MKYFLYILFIILYTSCAGNNPRSRTNENTDIEISDTIIINGKSAIAFGEDSIYLFSEDGTERSVIYTRYIPNDSIHYKKYNSNRKLIEIAYTKDTLLFDSIHMTDMYPRVDYVIQYQENGKAIKSGYVFYNNEELYKHATSQVWAGYCEFDSLGILIHRFIPTAPGSLLSYISEEYHNNGQLKLRWKQDYMYAGSFSLGYIQWDSLGNKTKQSIPEHFMPADGGSYNDVFTVSTTIEYYPNGIIKQISKKKSFTESGQCPCGRWDYYNTKGQLIKSVQYKSCYNFKLECDTVVY